MKQDIDSYLRLAQKPLATSTSTMMWGRVPSPNIATIGLGKYDDTWPCLQTCVSNNEYVHAGAPYFN